MSAIKVNCEKIEISNDNKICIIAGPCQLETEQHAMDMAGKIKEIAKKLDIGFIFFRYWFMVSPLRSHRSPSHWAPMLMVAVCRAPRFQ